MNVLPHDKAVSRPTALPIFAQATALGVVVPVAAVILYFVLRWDALHQADAHALRNVEHLATSIPADANKDEVSGIFRDRLALDPSLQGLRLQSPTLGRVLDGTLAEDSPSSTMTGAAGTLTVAMRREHFVGTLWRRFFTFFLPVVLLLLASAACVAWLERRRRALHAEKVHGEMARLDETDYAEPVRIEEAGTIGPDLERLRLALVDQRAELQTRNKELLDNAQLKTRFLANMSHEIRTPLTAILGFTELLDDDSLPSERRQRALDTVRRNGRHLLLIVNDVLDLSKIQAGRMTVERIPVAVREIVQDIEEVFAPRAQSKQITFDVNVDDSVPRLIESDPTRLRQVLANLVSNALKFTLEGEVLIRVSANTDVDPDGESEVLVRVRDTGVGMSEEAQRRIFEPFMQADNSVTRRYGGTGLGLAISCQLAELLGGELSCRSRKGEGSEFFLTIRGRVTRSASQILDDPPERGSSHPDPDGQRILVVEDSIDNQILIELLLKKYGAQVEVADNGREGLRSIRAANERGRPFHLILMDMQMPIMDGYEATRRIRENDSDLPIIALTAHALAGDRERCLRAGCSDFLSKPINRNALFRMLEDYGVKATKR